MTHQNDVPEPDHSHGGPDDAAGWQPGDNSPTALEDAYQSVRAHLHRPLETTDEVRDQLRSLLWLRAEAIEHLGHDGMALREVGDELTGEPPMSGRVRAILAIRAHAYRKELRDEDH